MGYLLEKKLGIQQELHDDSPAPPANDKIIRWVSSEIAPVARLTCNILP
jgi:hypothetical protein